uniref:Uncharacterized protein n=1 Tax=Candidatus Kentrum sp. TC TaxID=2126339 RepID=A0A450YUL4_9GAMM|nr:MAG: hypothetical protein BECKTC1821E_GA0114239_101117 [Candidatus Kentron sp. TC]VFK45241.1 MAG: hypothetical protein BECKTC1821D_GA0114238_102510 [Candidatus Kentron sp. TC]VFK63773.1 MAG: hypothetical protein BECKTC1821F_GA0114240_110510 [Candidatus Kentron sp. TC]
MPSSPRVRGLSFPFAKEQGFLPADWAKVFVIGFVKAVDATFTTLCSSLKKAAIFLPVRSIGGTELVPGDHGSGER